MARSCFRSCWLAAIVSQHVSSFGFVSHSAECRQTRRYQGCASRSGSSGIGGFGGSSNGGSSRGINGSRDCIRHGSTVFERIIARIGSLGRGQSSNFQWQLMDSLFEDIFENRGRNSVNDANDANDDISSNGGFRWNLPSQEEANFHFQQQQQQQHNWHDDDQKKPIIDEIDKPPKDYNDDAPPFSKFESAADRTRRMEMVRQLQKVYYAPQNQRQQHQHQIHQEQQQQKQQQHQQQSMSSNTWTDASYAKPSYSPFHRTISKSNTSIESTTASRPSSNSNANFNTNPSNTNNLNPITANPPNPNTCNPNNNNALPYGSTFLHNIPTLTSRDYISSSANSPTSAASATANILNDTSPYDTALLPGYQFLWSVSLPQHCHMFHSILSQSPPWYVVHVYIDGASDAVGDLHSTYEYLQNRLGAGASPYSSSYSPYSSIITNTTTFSASSSSSSHSSPSPLYGTLLRITDRRFQDHDGKIALAVQALDRVRIHKLSSLPGNSPFLTTDVEMYPEDELVKQYFDRALLTSALYYREREDTAYNAHSADKNDNGDGAHADNVNVDTIHAAHVPELGNLEQDEEEEEVEEEVEPPFHSSTSNSNNAAHPMAVVGAARAAATAEATRCRKFEYLPIFLEEMPKRPPSSRVLHNQNRGSSDAGKEQMMEEDGEHIEYNNVVQLINYDAIAYSTLEDANAVISQALRSYWSNLGREKNSQDGLSIEGDPFLDGGMSTAASPTTSITHITSISTTSPYSSSPYSSSNSPSLEAIEMLEYHLWRSLDEMIRLLSLASPTPVPLPSQLLGLLPKRNDWPKEFVLENYAQSLSSTSSGGGGRTSRGGVGGMGTVGTFVKSPFVRVDEVTQRNEDTSTTESTSSSASGSTSDNTPGSWSSGSPNETTSSYSTIRRAQRISYAIWLLLDGLAMTGAQPPPPSRPVILSMNSVGERLDAAKRTLEGINGILRRLIPENRKSEE